VCVGDFVGLLGGSIVGGSIEWRNHELDASRSNPQDEAIRS